MVEKTKAYWITYYIIIAIVISIFSYGCWRLERYINWKFGYKTKVNKRMEKAEIRIKKLEKIAGIDKNSLKSEK